MKKIITFALLAVLSANNFAAESNMVVKASILLVPLASKTGEDYQINWKKAFTNESGESVQNFTFVNSDYTESTILNKALSESTMASTLFQASLKLPKTKKQGNITVENVVQDIYLASMKNYITHTSTIDQEAEVTQTELIQGEVNTGVKLPLTYKINGKKIIFKGTYFIQKVTGFNYLKSESAVTQSPIIYKCNGVLDDVAYFNQDYIFKTNCIYDENRVIIVLKFVK